MVETMAKNIYPQELLDNIKYLVSSEPNDQTLGNRVREFINNLLSSEERRQLELEKENRRFKREDSNREFYPTIDDSEQELKNLINSYYGRGSK